MWILVCKYNNGEQYAGSKYQYFYVLFMDIKKSIYCPCGKEIKSARGGG